MAPGSRPRIAAAKVEVGRIEGAGEPAFLPAGMDSVNQFPGELAGRHPHTGEYPGVFRSVLRLEPRFSYIH